MLPVTYLLLFSLGGLFLVSIFHFTIYLQQKDRAYLHYAGYLFVMSCFTVVRILDARLTAIFPLSYYEVETLDPLFSNLGFLMYVNFLGFVLNVQPTERFHWRSWRFIQYFIGILVPIYTIMRMLGLFADVSGLLVSVASLAIVGFGLVLVLRLVRRYREHFFRLIITGTLVAVCGVAAGLIVNLVQGDKLAFGGLVCMQSAMMIETVFLSAALGYRLRQIYRDREAARQELLEETKRSEALAVQTAELLRRELDVQLLKSRISRDLHDDIGASLSSIHIYSDVARRLVAEQPQKATAVLEQISENARAVIENMSDIVWAMKGGEEGTTALSARIRNLGSELLTPAGIDATYSFDSEIDTLVQDVQHRRNLCLLVKEMLHNIVKYSGATQVLVTARLGRGTWRLQVSDNGCGFDPLSVRRGNGLGNLQSRARDIGGSCVIESAPGQGTLVGCTIPLPKSSEEATSAIG